MISSTPSLQTLCGSQILTTEAQTRRGRSCIWSRSFSYPVGQVVTRDLREPSVIDYDTVYKV